MDSGQGGSKRGGDAPSGSRQKVRKNYARDRRRGGSGSGSGSGSGRGAASGPQTPEHLNTEQILFAPNVAIHPKKHMCAVDGDFLPR